MASLVRALGFHRMVLVKASTMPKNIFVFRPVTGSIRHVDVHEILRW